MDYVNILGSKVSVITESENKFEGILYAVDAKERTISLINVKVLGTEGRPAKKEVQPSDVIIDQMIFRDDEVKEFQIKNRPASSASNFPFDPAVVQHSSALPYNVCQNVGYLCLEFLTQYLNQMNYVNAQPSCASNVPLSNRYGAAQTSQKKVMTDAGVQVSEQLQKADRDSRNFGRDFGRPLMENNRVRPQYQRGYISNRRPFRGRGFRRGRGRGRSSSLSRNQTLRFDSEYDFELANAEFKELENKLSKNVTEAETLPNEETADDDETAYDKAAYDKAKSFFDNISCEASRSTKGIPRFDWRIEKKLNVETFGVPVSANWLRYRRGRGGFRRGARGRDNSTFNKVGEKSDAPKTVTFGEKLVTAEIERPATPLVKNEDIPIIEMVAPKETWEEPSEANKEQWK